MTSEPGTESENVEAAPTAAPARPVRGAFFAARWRGEVPLGQLFWQDMLIFGTGINIATAIVAALLFVRDAPTAIAALIYFAPVPYNFFLVAAVWRKAADAREPVASAARLGALLWIVVAMLI